RLPPISPLFPYTTLFRSQFGERDAQSRLVAAPLRILPTGSASRLADHRDFRQCELFVRSRCRQLASRIAVHGLPLPELDANWRRSEEHTSELQSLAYLVC